MNNKNFMNYTNIHVFSFWKWILNSNGLYFTFDLYVRNCGFQNQPTISRKKWPSMYGCSALKDLE